MRIRALAMLSAAALVSFSACTDANQTNTGPVSGENTTTCEYPSAGEPAKAVDAPATTGVPTQGEVTATLELTAGDVTITMDRAKAPCTVNSFVSLAEQGYFDDTVCHRLTDYGIFVLQCGDPSATGMGGPGYSYADELEPVKDLGQAAYPTGTVAMANAGPDTNGSQFFLVYADSQLAPDYTVFGTMDQAGIDVVGGIAAQGVDAGDQTSPIAEAKITAVTLG
ncbi:peptidylprolyl isomerase [Tessaracoccus sp. MC1756]|uniref:peptidylprolyl isomerase n=1 Tax=Tessaracoccus sp. MC1756 TaxID=2760311 RepID=UPI00351C966A